MKAIIQRVREACVKVENKIIGEIEHGLLIYLGIIKGDKKDQAVNLAKKIANYRVFPDENYKMNKSLLDVKGGILVISQFTLAAEGKKGNRPSFDKAMSPSEAVVLYEQFIEELSSFNIKVSTGQFGAMMDIASINYGPVTFILEK